MDKHEEHNTEQMSQSQTPEESAPENPPPKQAKSPDNGKQDTAPAGQGGSPPKNAGAAKQNAKQTHSLPDDPKTLKSLVKQRDSMIADLRSRNQDLQQKLNEKEKVVTALTSRLEQAAEQLDRLHRSGADRGGKLLAGIPSEVIDEQRDLINDLKAAIQTWEELQSTSAMGRFEAQLGELREMLAEQLDLKDRIDSAPAPKTSAFTSTPSPATGPQKSSWDEMKAQLLGDSHSSSAAQKANDSDVMIPGAAAGSDEDEGGATSEGKSKFEEKYETDYVIDIPDRPAAIKNLDKADVDTLKKGIKERDEHIDKLMEVIDALKEISGQEDLEEAKKRHKKLEDRLKKAEEQMKEKLRQAEIEMSMERAKLAREAARLQQMGGHSPDEIDDGPEAAGASEDKGSRWARFLGSK